MSKKTIMKKSKKSYRQFKKEFKNQDEKKRIRKSDVRRIEWKMFRGNVKSWGNERPKKRKFGDKKLIYIASFTIGNKIQQDQLREDIQDLKVVGQRYRVTEGIDTITGKKVKRLWG